MQINQVSSPGVARTTGSGTQRPRVGGSTDQAIFTQAQGLDEALGATPDVRGAEVARAKGLVSSLKYPPDELVDRISHLLAFKQKSSAQ